MVGLIFSWVVVMTCHFFMSWILALCAYWAPLDQEIHPNNTAEYASFIASSRDVPITISSDQEGIGSRFGDPGDELVGGTLACEPDRKVGSVRNLCAHRSYPCGTILILENQKNKKRSWCVVADRGPYGANVFAKDGRTKILTNSGRPAWYIKTRNHPSPPESLCLDGGCTGRWRGVIDVSPAASEMMGHSGLSKMRVWRLERIVDHKIYLARKKVRPSS